MDVFRIKDFEIRNRLFVGTGKYSSGLAMRASLAAAGTQLVTVALRAARRP